MSWQIGMVRAGILEDVMSRLMEDGMSRQIGGCYEQADWRMV
jgi:hypothetical protein